MKTKRSKLKASSRDNRRYFLIQGKPNDREKVEESILEYIGVLGMARSGFMFVEHEKKLIGSCLREGLEEIRASLAWKKLQIQKVSGTLKGLEA